MSKKSKRKPRFPRRQKKQLSPIKMVLGISTIIAGLGAVAISSIQDAGYAKADVNGCYAQNNGHTFALVDSSDPRFDAAQTRDLRTAFEQLYANGLAFNERFTIVTTDESRIGSVPAPVLVFCRSARSAEDLEGVGAKGARPEYLRREATSYFDKVLSPAMDEIFDPNPADAQRQRRESPILEQIQSVARQSNFDARVGKRRLIIISDLIQATQEAQFCVEKGHLPSFEKFKSSSYFNHVRPASLTGVDVQIYMLIRDGYGEGQLPYCSEDELRKFWTDYFTDAGADRVEIIRLRKGG